MSDTIQIEDIARVRLDPSDVLVLRVHSRLSVEMVKHIQEQLEECFPGHKAVILEDRARLDVMTPAQIEGST